jgi:prepilin-type N-terminal cleavage/methylation domain-containing protein
MKASRSYPGFTLIELLIVIAIASIVLTISLTTCAGVSGRGKDIFGADQSMNNYVRQLYPELYDIRVSCATIDSDGDGYIRCTATGLDATNTRQQIEAECGWLLNSGKCAPIKHGRGYRY